MVWLRCKKESSRGLHSYRLLLQITDAVDIDPNVFLYLALPLRENETDQTAVFQGVCSPHDMVDQPVGTPYPNAEPPWVRHDTVDLLFPSLSEMQDAWTLLQEELQSLLTSYQDLQVLDASEVLEFGDLSEVGGSSV